MKWDDVASCEGEFFFMCRIVGFETNPIDFNEEGAIVMPSRVFWVFLGVPKINSSDANGKENSNGDGIVQQKQILAEKQIEIKKQLANLHLEQKKIKKYLNNKIIT